MTEDDQDFIESTDAEELANEADPNAELSGLEDEAATLADSELEDEENMPMEGQEIQLQDVLPHAHSDHGDAGYGRDE